MARLHEYQGKALLAGAGFVVPRGGVAASADEAAGVARSVGGPVVVKVQAWTTGRAAIGGVAFADSPEAARGHAARLLGMKVGNFPVERVIVEEKIAIARELFVSLSIDDRARAPVILLAPGGGSGIEERARDVQRIGCDVASGPDRARISELLKGWGIDGPAREAAASAIAGVFTVARAHEARSVEINPLAITKDGRVVAADCRMTIDDYAVFRHEDLGIGIARELDHPPTALERAAYEIEQADHRGTFYFAQLATEAAPGTRGLIGFHGAGGGGSMMSMDAITNAGFTIANFTDTSGNPSAAKVYRAARIILAQPGLCGYFGSGSGVASQEQFWSAYGLAKAFLETNLSIPAVIRLGGNSEERAVEILEEACRGLPGVVEGFTKDDTPAAIAHRFGELVEAGAMGSHTGSSAASRRVPAFVGAASSVSFPINSGMVWVDPDRWGAARATIDRFAPGLFTNERGRPALGVPPEEFAGKDSELIAAEIECRRAGTPALFVDLPIPLLDTSTP